MSEGWISLHRKIQNNPLYFSEPFNRVLAWIDILLLCNHQDNYIYVRGNKIDIKRGQFAWGEEALASRWKWSRGKVRRFLIMLENNGNLIQQKNNILSLYTVLNYNEYQQNSTTDGQQTVQQTDINNNDNNENKVKGWVKPTSTTPSLKGDVFAPKYGNKDINLILGALSRLNTTGKLDSSEAENRKHAQNLLKKYGKEEILRVIKALPTVPFWSGKVTSAGLLLRHFNAIINSLPKKQEYTFL